MDLKKRLGVVESVTQSGWWRQQRSEKKEKSEKKVEQKNEEETTESTISRVLKRLDLFKQELYF